MSTIPDLDEAYHVAGLPVSVVQRVYHLDAAAAEALQAEAEAMVAADRAAKAAAEAAEMGAIIADPGSTQEQRRAAQSLLGRAS